MNKFYNGEGITKENLLKLIKESIDTNWHPSDLQLETEKILTFIATHDYNGKEDDIEYILEQLQASPAYTEANLQDVERIILDGDWFFQVAMKEPEV